MQEGMLWHKERNGIRCDLCARKCFIGKDKLGYCQVRKSDGSSLLSLNYGKITGSQMESIEKLPLYHFFPASTSLTVSSFGCNFNSNFCPEFETGKELHRPLEKIKFQETTPEKIVKMAEDNSAKSITFSHSEPFINFEFAFKTAKLSHRSNLKNIFVSNGYAMEDSVKKIAKFLDAIVINFTASGNPEFYKKYFDGAEAEMMFDALKQIKKNRIHAEITNTIVPNIGDDPADCKKLAEWINGELGSEVPFHILQFHPNKNTPDLPLTPVSTLDKCADEIKKAGIRYVYIGRIPGHVDENTYCYNCREPLVMRKGGVVKKVNLSKDRCPNCGLRINIFVE